MSGITTHILDTSRGRPAQGVPVKLAFKRGEEWEEVGSGETDDDGRLGTLTEGRELEIGTWAITFDTDAYFRHHGVEGFYPEVTITFEIRVASEHYHVPLLLNPFGFSTYRGS